MITASPPDTASRLGLDQNGIMWCDRTLQPGLAGCEKISPACKGCYAEVTAAGIVRKGTSEKSAPGMRATADFYAEGLTPDGSWTGRVSVHPERIAAAFAKLPKRPGKRPLRVFVTSMSDLFHEDVPFEFIAIVYGAMAARPWINFQILTKRADRMAEFYRWLGRDGQDEWETIINAADAHDGDGHEPALLGGGLYVGQWPIPNIWAGVTVEDQRRADERIPWLLQVPVAVRFLSVEPMLGEVEIPSEFLTGEYAPHDIGGAMAEEDGPRISWVIVGSESDGPRPGARETRHEWIEDLVGQCDDAGVPVFVKQAAIDGRLCALPEVNGRVRAEFPG